MSFFGAFPPDSELDVEAFKPSMPYGGPLFFVLSADSRLIRDPFGDWASAVNGCCDDAAEELEAAGLGGADILSCFRGGSPVSSMIRMRALAAGQEVKIGTHIMAAGSRILDRLVPENGGNLYFTVEGISFRFEFGQYSKLDTIVRNTDLSSSSLFFHTAAVNELQLSTNSITRSSHKSM